MQEIHPIVSLTVDAPPLWDGERNGALTCHAIKQETHDVSSFFFRDAAGGLFRHRPGQFLTFSFDVAGAVLQRCYTISSPPTRPDTISITVKRTPGGAVSNWLHDHLRVGDAVHAFGPNGVFSCLEHPAQKYLFISGGSGITPLMSMARYFDQLQQEPDILFVHAARAQRDIVFHDELIGMGGRRRRMRNIFVCEDIKDAPAGTCHPGRVNSSLLEAIAPDLHQREVFCCGPAPFMAAIRSLLVQAGHDSKRYHEESFTFEELPQNVNASSQVSASGTQAFSVYFSLSGKTVSCAPDQTVLEAARGAGIMIPCSCTKGICGTCKSRLLSGEVEMRHAGGIRQREIDQGKILACCSRPLGNLVIER